MKFNRIVAGKKAREAGNSFEDIFRAMAETQGIGVIRIPNGSTIKRTPQGIKTFPAPSPFDWILGHKGDAVLIDTKSLDKGTLSFSDLKTHQVKNLAKMEAQGICGGYVVNFRPLDQIVFFNAGLLKSLKRKQSLKPDDGIILGGIDNFNTSILFQII